MSKITTIRRVANGSFQAEIQDLIDNQGKINVLAKLNKGDDRFSQGSLRRAWFPVTLQSLEELGVSAKVLGEINKLEEKQVYELNLENPSIDGEELVIQVTESIVPDQYQRDNVMKVAKQLMIDEKVAANKGLVSEYTLSKYIGQNGYFVDEDGNFIFSRTTVTIKAQRQHTFLKGVFVPETELANYGATLAETVNINTEVSSTTVNANQFKEETV